MKMVMLALVLYSLWKVVFLETVTGNEVIAVDVQTALEEVKEAFERKCDLHGGIFAYDELKNSINRLPYCMIPNIGRRVNYDNIEDLICSDFFRQKLIGCFKRIADSLGHCLGSEEAFLTDFIVQAVARSMEYDCKDNHRNLDANNEAARLGNCRLSGFQVDVAIEHCFTQFRILQKRNDRPELVITKEDLCHDLQIAKTCLADYIRTECPFAIGVAEHTTGVYNAYLELCTEAEKEESWN